MVYRCIVVGYDGSDASRRAVDRAAGIAKLSGSKLAIVTVVPPPTVFLGELLVPEVLDTSPLEEAARQSLEKVAKELRETVGIENLSTVVLMGDPADEIVGFAEDNGCDLIVVGRRGRGGLERLILGSVSSKIVSISHGVDVLVVESGQKSG